MSAPLPSPLSSLAPVDLDPEGTFKYVLIEAYQTVDGTEHCKLLVRGWARAEYHADIYDEVEEGIRKQGLDAQCLGGGRIQHNPQNKYVKVYGYSMGFGRADHTKAVTLIKEKYPGYTVEWSNEGY